MKKICILDYGVGNIRSVTSAVVAAGADASVSSELSVLSNADGMIIPGVGGFAHCMARLHAANLVDAIHSFVSSGRAVLGICVGMQMLFDRGTEFELTDGLGIIRGTVDRIPLAPIEGRLPHIAWSTVEPKAVAKSTMFAQLGASSCRFYFLHSYAAMDVPAEYVSGTATYQGKKMVAAVQMENVWGTQFHPEKSGPNGLQLLANFIHRC